MNVFLGDMVVIAYHCLVNALHNVLGVDYTCKYICISITVYIVFFHFIFYVTIL